MNSGRKGRYYEHKTRHLLQRTGYYTVRSAGSKGIIDLVAISGKGIRLIQVKGGSSAFSSDERARFLNLKAPSNCSKEVWKWKGYGKPQIDYLGV